MLDSTRVGADSLDGADDLHRLDIASGDTAEDDVLAVEPRGNDGGDEELGAVAAARLATELVKVGLLKLTCWGRRWPWTGGRACRA